MLPQAQRLLRLAAALALAQANSWSGPRVEVVQGNGLPSFELTFGNGSTQRTPALWLVGGEASLFDRVARFNTSEARSHREQVQADAVGVRIFSAELSFVGYGSSPELLPNGSVAPAAMAFLGRALAQAPDALFIARIRLDLKAPYDPRSRTRPGSVVMQSIANSSDVVADHLASPTRAWAARLGNLTARAMRSLDAAFPGRVLGAQILHGVSYEANYPGAWSAASVEGMPAGIYDHKWPDYSPDAIEDFCRGRSGGCAAPTAAQRNRPTLGNTLITADTAAGANAVAFNRFINVQMAEGIAAVGSAIKEASGGRAFLTTLYGGSLFNGPSYATAGGSAAQTELLGAAGIDGTGNPPLCKHLHPHLISRDGSDQCHSSLRWGLADTAASRSDL